MSKHSSSPTAWTIAALEKTFPSIRWIDPVMVHWPDRVTFACRICIANKGLKKLSDHQFGKYVECLEHIKEHQP